MSLKSLLQTLCGRFYSRQDSAEVAKLALPGMQITTQIINSSETDRLYTSPCNGYASIVSNDGSASTIVLECNGVRSAMGLVDGGWLSVQIPVTKGSNVAARIYPGSATLRFMSAFGGGLIERLISFARGEVRYGFA